VDPLTLHGNEDLAADLGPLLGTRDKVAIARFHREASLLLLWALKHGELAAGGYRLAHLDNAGMERRLQRELARFPGLPKARVATILAELPRLDPDGQFRFTDQHRRLLRGHRLEWPHRQLMRCVASSGYPAPAVDFKRPFGVTAFSIDMAAILGLAPAQGETIDPLLGRLYWEMWPALQAFVEHVTVATDLRRSWRLPCNEECRGTLRDPNKTILAGPAPRTTRQRPSRKKEQVAFDEGAGSEAKHGLNTRKR
jgi:hypothetical protein